MRNHAESSCFQLPFVPGRDGPRCSIKGPCTTLQKNPRPTKPAELHTAISTPPFAFVRPRVRARAETLGSGRGAGRGAGFREAGPCRWVRRRWRRICATCSPGPVPTHRLDSPPACLPAGSHNGSGCRGRPSGLGMHNNSARRCADRAVNRGRRSICLGNRRPGDGLGTAVTLGHRRVQPNAGAPRARPARAVRFARMHGSGAVWPAQGGPTRGELQRAWRWGKAGRRPMQRTRPSVALLLVMEVHIPRCSQQCRM